MRRIFYDVAISRDGFIAGPDDDISLFPAEGDHVAAYLARLDTYDTVLMGRRTYEFGYRFGLEPGANPYPKMEAFVISASLDLPPKAEVTQVTEDAVSRIEAMKAGDGGDIYLCGGGRLAGTLMSAGLIDRLRLKVAPAVFGQGVPLFGGVICPQKMKTVERQTYASGVTYEDWAITG